jgi:hypothetical protein
MSVSNRYLLGCNNLVLIIQCLSWGASRYFALPIEPVSLPPIFSEAQWPTKDLESYKFPLIGK